MAREVRQEGLVAARVTLKLRFADFHTLTRSHTGEPTQEGLEIHRRVTALLDREVLPQPVRLIGLSVSGLRAETTRQRLLLDRTVERRERLARVVDRLAARFGTDVVQPATLARPRGPAQGHGHER